MFVQIQKMSNSDSYGSVYSDVFYGEMSLYFVLPDLSMSLRQNGFSYFNEMIRNDSSETLVVFL